MGRIGLVFIDCIEGNYSFPQDIEKNIDELANQSVQQAFEPLALLNCYSMDDVIECILDKELEEFAFYCPESALVFARVVCEKLSRIKSAVYYWVLPSLESSCICTLDSIEIAVFPDLNSLLLHGTHPCMTTEVSFSKLLEVSAAASNQVKKSAYREIMHNGFTIMLTGKYPNSYIYSKAKHVYVPEPCLLDEYFLADHMDINSAIFVPRGKIDDATYARLKERYYNHIHVVDSRELYFDNKEEAIPWDMMRYSDFYHNGLHETKVSTPYLRVSHADDRECFAKDLYLFEAEGIIRDYNFYLVNECRWANRCPMQYQKRFTFHRDGGVSPCFENNQPMYNVKDEEYNQFITREKALEQTQIARQCKDCKAENRCTKCPVLPQTMKEEDFCRFVKEFPIVSEFINVKNVLLLMDQYSSFAQTVDLGKIQFSNCANALLFPPDLKSKKVIDQNIYIFKKDDDYYYYNPIQGQIIRVGYFLAFILEGIQKGYTYDEIRKAFQRNWDGAGESHQDFDRAWNDVQAKILSFARGGRL